MIACGNERLMFTIRFVATLPQTLLLPRHFVPGVDILPTLLIFLFLSPLAPVKDRHKITRL